MFKNFTSNGLGITGRQSELIELALTYAFRGMDVDMPDMLKRTQRTTFNDAAKYLLAADIKVGTFDCGVDLDADDQAFATQLAQVHPLTELAEQLKSDAATVMLPTASDRLAFPENFELLSQRVKQIGEVLATKNIRLGVGFCSGVDQGEEKQFPFIAGVEGYLAFLKNVASDSIGALVDTWTWHVGGGTQEQLTSLPVEQIVAVRIGKLADGVEASAATAGDRILATVEGPIDHVAFVKHLAAGDYQGSLSPTASAAHYKGQTREAIVNKAQEAIDSILKAADLPVPPRPMDNISLIPYEPAALN